MASIPNQVNVLLTVTWNIQVCVQAWTSNTMLLYHQSRPPTCEYGTKLNKWTTQFTACYWYNTALLTTRGSGSCPATSVFARGTPNFTLQVKTQLQSAELADTNHSSTPNLYMANLVSVKTSLRAFPNPQIESTISLSFHCSELLVYLPHNGNRAQNVNPMCT